MSRAYHIPLRVLFYEEHGATIAHCLEFDLLGSGSHRSEALEQLGHAIAMQVEHAFREGQPRLLFNPAPRELELMFAAGDDVALGELQLPLPGGQIPYQFESPRFRQFVPENSELG